MAPTGKQDTGQSCSHYTHVISTETSEVSGVEKSKGIDFVKQTDFSMRRRIKGAAA